MSPVRKPSALQTAAARPAKDTLREPSQPIDASPAPQRRPRPEKPVRFTLDLAPTDHKFLKQYALEAEAGSGAEIMRTLLAELRDDPELAARVKARIWSTKQ